MSRRRFKSVRIAVALGVFIPLTLAFIDFRNELPPRVGHWFASLQFIPASISLATGAAVGLLVLAILLITLLFGRVYCSTICPLGVLQDIAIRLRSGFSNHPANKRIRPESTRWRYAILGIVILGFVFGGTGTTLALFDPYSNFGRIASGIFRPLVININNQLVSFGEAIGWNALYRVTAPPLSLAQLALPLLTLATVMGFAFWRGRLFCNTICPVGTLLGWVAKHAAWTLKINAEKCRKCARCLRVCKSQCIDLRSGAIDFSRCVGCYNCLAACDDRAIHFRYAWRGNATPRPSKPSEQPIHSSARREFIGKSLLCLGSLTVPRLDILAAGSAEIFWDRFASGIAPPGAFNIPRFLNQCTACHLCISACPTQVLQPAFAQYGWRGFLKPHLEVSQGFCNFDCRSCSEACPNGAIQLLDLASKQTTKIGEAEFVRDRCIVITKGTDCAACSEHCPTKAVFTKPHGENLRLPEVAAHLCIGCGACEHACPVRPLPAIRVTGLRVHERAVRQIEATIPTPRTDGDFPF